LVPIHPSSGVRRVHAVSGFLRSVYGSKSALEVGISYAPRQAAQV
jgi:hypothetical protein